MAASTASVPSDARMEKRQRRVMQEIEAPSNQAKGHNAEAEVMESADSVKARLVKARAKGQMKGLRAV